jgi:tRNA A-37 threonylcarbamoyl transferase component Bud32
MSKVLYRDRTTNVTLKDNKVTKIKNSIRQTEIDAQILAHNLGLAPKIYSFILGNKIEMEYIEGITLDQYIRTKCQDQQDRQILKRKVSNVLSKMYDSGIKHGDLTGNNIIITPNEEVKIIDYEHSVLYKNPVPANLRDHTILRMF